MGLSTGEVCESCGAPMTARSSWERECRACGFLASSLPAGGGTGIEGLEALRRANYEILLDRVGAFGPLNGKRLLEVGSAWGWFLEAARRRGALVQGIEPELANAEASRSKGFSVEHGYFPQDLGDDGPFDLIVFNDVFEHIPRPSALAGAIEKRLAPGGLLVVNLPSSNGTIFRIARLLDAVGLSGPYERMWQKDFPSPHVSYFNSANLERMIGNHSGLRQRLVFALPSVSRDGLADRIHASHRGLAGAAILAGMYALSYLLPALPPDIMVAVFRNEA